MAEEPRVSVRQRVDVELSAQEVMHALRCWVAHTLVENNSVPKPNKFEQICVTVTVDIDGVLSGASLAYEPETPQP